LDSDFLEEVNELIEEQGGEPITLRLLKQDLEFINADEWHHTSKYGNKTNYYSAETIADYYLTKKGRVRMPYCAE